MELSSLSKGELWKEWKKALEALCDDQDNMILRMKLDHLEEEITNRVCKKK
jgi:predicted negative regulator of RcsB-dependent stress response